MTKGNYAYTPEKRLATQLAAQQRAEREFRERYAGTKSTILEYIPGNRDLTQKPQARFICWHCNREVVEFVRAGRKVDLQCARCLTSTVHERRLESGWKPPQVRRTFTTAQVKAELEKYGVTPTFDEYTGPNQKLTFLCSCPDHRPGEITWRNLHYASPRTGKTQIPRCRECIEIFLRSAGKTVGVKTLKHEVKYTTEVVQRLFRDYGAEPLFANYSGNIREKLRFRCATCTREAKISFAAFQEGRRGVEDYQLRCKSCKAMGVDRSKYNQQVTKRILDYFSQQGVTPLFKEYPGKNSAPLHFACSCAEHGVNHVTWNQIVDSGFTFQLRCQACQLAARPRGESHPNWIADRTEEEREIRRTGRGQSMVVWSRLVRSFYNYCCVITNERGHQLPVHHLEGWEDAPERRFVVNNGVPLAESVHWDFHASCGGPRSPFTREDFTRFYQERTGREFQHILRGLEAEVIFAFEPKPNLLERKQVLAVDGIRYLPFYEGEVRTKLPIVLSMIRQRNGEPLAQIGARKLKVVNLSTEQAKIFFEVNHIQGFGAGELYYALANDEGELFTAMSFGRARFKGDSDPEGTYELVRFATKLNWQVPGGASRLFKAFLKNNRPPLIVSYADRRFCSEDPELTVYPGLGFTFVRASHVSYCYTFDGVTLESRMAFQRRYLEKKLPDYDPSLTEKENMVRAGYVRLEDCGTFVYHWRP